MWRLASRLVTYFQPRVGSESGHAKVAVVGSAILDIINESKKDYLKKVEKFLKELR